MSGIPFQVISKNEKYVFLSPNIECAEELAKELFEYFFDKDKLFSYFRALEPNFIFEPTPVNYKRLFDDLKIFIDEDLTISKLDKIGKLGEYFLSILLMDYFHNELLLPKLVLITNENMSVHGIDTVHYSIDDNMLMFGEAKFCRNLKNGMELINLSLSDYESTLESEYSTLIRLDVFEKAKINNVKEMAVNQNQMRLRDFITECNMNKIGVPLFICHGEDNAPVSIFKKVENINMKKELLELPVKYLIISLPINDKGIFCTNLSKLISLRMNEYQLLCKLCGL